MAVKKVAAYDTRTGRKLPQRVPVTWLRIFPNLSETPVSSARSGKKSDQKGTDSSRPEPTASGNATRGEDHATKGR